MPRRPLPRFDTPIVPRNSISGRALVAVVAIMTFLASLTTGAVMLVRRGGERLAVRRRARGHHPGPPGAGPRPRRRRRASAAAIARAFPGIGEVRAYTKEESAQPARAVARQRACRSTNLPVPRLIVVKIARRRRARHSAAAPDAGRAGAGRQLDDHRGWIDRMRAMAGTAVAAGVGVLILMLAATMLSVTFATRGAMATNRPVIEVLHFVGAKNGFIAGHFQRHFLLLGLQGGAIGGGAAIAAVRAGRRCSAAGSPAPPAASRPRRCSARSRSGLPAMSRCSAQVVLIALVTALTSRHTVNRTLETID